MRIHLLLLGFFVVYLWTIIYLIAFGTNFSDGRAENKAIFIQRAKVLSSDADRDAWNSHNGSALFSDALGKLDHVGGPTLQENKSTMDRHNIHDGLKLDYYSEKKLMAYYIKRRKKYERNNSLDLDEHLRRRQGQGQDWRSKLNTTHFSSRPNRFFEFQVYKQFVEVPTPKQCSQHKFMVIFINSKVNNRKRRDAIRQTWGSVSRTRRWPRVRGALPGVGIIFVLARGLSSDDDNGVLDEIAVHRDVLLGNFTDTYRNITMKSLLAMKFASEHCAHVPFFVKTDDDVFVHVPRLSDLLVKLGQQHVIVGPCTVGADVMRQGKWRLSYREYPYSTFPPYMAGSGYVISMPLVSKLFDASRSLTDIFIDDAYITGILAHSIGAEVSRNYTHQFSFVTDKIKRKLDVTKSDKVIFLGFDDSKLNKVWQSLNDNNSNSTAVVFSRPAKLSPNRRRQLPR